jgi:glutaredoxin 3
MTSSHTGAKVEIYSRTNCSYCVFAKKLLENRNIPFIEYIIDNDEKTYQKMMQRVQGRRSLPQIFINDYSIGGFVELRELDKSGRLDMMLGIEIGSGENGNQAGE